MDMAYGLFSTWRGETYSSEYLLLNTESRKKYKIRTSYMILYYELALTKNIT